MIIEAVVATDVGKKRDKNEDAYLIDESLGLYVVCDGMGGHAAGEVASAKTVEFVAQYLKPRRGVIEAAENTPGGHFPIVKLVEEAIAHACQGIHELACANPELRGMGTTITLIVAVGHKAIMGHVGDSRLYLIRGEDVHLLSTDHTLAHELVTDGLMTQEEADAGNFGHALTRVVGCQASVQVESLLFDLLPGDVFVLCSDGLSNYLESVEQLKSLLAPEPNAQKLVDFANDQGGADNITATVMRVTGEKSKRVEERIRVLSESFLCKGMPQSRLLRVLNACEVKVRKNGDRVTEPGLYFVLKGEVDTKEEVFGGLSLVGETMVPRSVVADSSFLFLSKTRFQGLAKKLPKAGRHLYKNLSEELAEQLTNMTTMSSGDTVDWKPE